MFSCKRSVRNIEENILKLTKSSTVANVLESILKISYILQLTAGS